MALSMSETAAFAQGDAIQEATTNVRSGPIHRAADVSALVFAADRVAWFPNRTDERQGIQRSHVFLAQRGMDIGLFDDARDHDRRPLSAGDRECFYELLAAVGQAPRDQLMSYTASSLDVGDAIADSRVAPGEIRLLRGGVRRVTRILIENADVTARFGFKFYYQLDVFVPLGNRVIVFGRGDSGPKPTFTNRYPVTVCTLTLPDGLAEGDHVDREVVLAAAFFRLWSYRSQYVSAIDSTQLQVSPLFVSAEPILLAEQTHVWLLFTLGAIFLLLLAAIWFLLWRWRSGDQRFAQRVLRRSGNERRPISPGRDGVPT
jgi:hypothetical protein